MADPHAPRISVIVPICNVAAFLDQCLESIEYQTARDMEIICLNDGSTDDSLAIMKRHAAADARIRVVDKENEGYGATCNRGIELASGDYVAIVEPDDYLLPTMFEDLLAFADSFEHPADVVKEAWFDVVGWDDPLSERVVPGYLYKRLKTTREPQSIEGVPELLEGHPLRADEAAAPEREAHGVDEHHVVADVPAQHEVDVEAGEDGATDRPRD